MEKRMHQARYLKSLTLLATLASVALAQPAIAAETANTDLAPVEVANLYIKTVVNEDEASIAALNDYLRATRLAGHQPAKSGGRVSHRNGQDHRRIVPGCDASEFDPGSPATGGECAGGKKRRYLQDHRRRTRQRRERHPDCRRQFRMPDRQGAVVVGTGGAATGQKRLQG